ncbi:MAG: ABC transporter permease [Candidatus Dormiibacterota bacterium]
MSTGERAAPAVLPQSSAPDRAVLAGRLPRGTLGRELLVVIARRRTLVLKVCIPLILAVPLIAGGAPSFWAATLLTVMVAMVGAVGSAVTLARARQSGLLTRLSLAPKPGWRVLGGVIGGGALVDLLQLLPVILLVAAAGGAGPEWWVALLFAVLAALLCGSVLGCLVSALAGGVGEVLLDVCVLLAPLLFLGGLFTGVPRIGWGWSAALVDPFGELDSAFIGALGGTAAFPAATVVAICAAAIVISVGAIGVLSRPLLERR